MTNLSDLLNVDMLEIELQDGYVRERQHPDDPALTIFNYTEKAQYERRWNTVTSQCRGLIVDSPTGTVLARPFDKFFNAAEHDDLDDISSDSMVEVLDKADGSLGILYPGPDGLAIATRGSFESEQAKHATELFRKQYADRFEPVPGLTYLFEIVYPENRIVLDYGEIDDLLLLGTREIESGITRGPGTPAGWPGAGVEILHYATTLANALRGKDRPNREGVVLRFLETGLMLKVKQDDYVRLHKLVTGLNEKAVWEHLLEHKGAYGDLLASVPDEFHQWVTTTAEALIDQHEDLMGWAHVAYNEILDDLGVTQPSPEDNEFRKRFAKEAQMTDHPALLFQMLDGRDISPTIWKSLKPKGETPSLLNRTEDNA